MRSRMRGLCALLAVFVAQDVAAQTLLEVQAAGHALDFVDPGSGTKLASVDVAAGPNRVAVSPDGKLAAVLSCSAQSGGENRSAVSLSIVDLEHPKELRRLPVALPMCPTDLIWFASGRLAVTFESTTSSQVIDAASGEVAGELAEGDRAAVRRAGEHRQAFDLTTVAVQQFLAGGGDLRQLATTPVIPRAVCHACTPER